MKLNAVSFLLLTSMGQPPNKLSATAFPKICSSLLCSKNEWTSSESSRLNMGT